MEGEDSPFLTSHPLSPEDGRPSVFPKVLGNLTDTSFCSQVHTPAGTVGACPEQGLAGLSARFQVFSSVSTTTTVPSPADNSMEPSRIALVPDAGHTLHQLQRGLCPPPWPLAHEPGALWSQESDRPVWIPVQPRAILAEAQGLGWRPTLSLLVTAVTRIKKTRQKD